MELNDVVALLGTWSQRAGPLYQRLAAAFEDTIQQGNILPGTKLPAERLLAQALSISRSTVVAAYAHLEQNSWLERRRGSGSWVKAATQLQHAEQRANWMGLFARNPAFGVTSHDPHETIDFSAGTSSSLAGAFQDAFVLTYDDLMQPHMSRGYSPAGLPVLRKAVADMYTRMGIFTTEDQILITTGAQQAITLLAQFALQRGDTVLIENPTYFGAIDAFRAAGARLIPIPMNEAGIDITMLRDTILATSPRLIYIIPTFQNPTGTVLSGEQRRAIARIVGDYTIPIIEDTTLADLAISGEAPSPLAAYARSGPVLTIGSLSKLFWAGLRVGWIRGPQATIQQITRLKAVADLGSSFVSQAIAARLLPELVHIKELRRQELSQRLDFMEQLLHEFLPSWTWKRPTGGLFLWVRLPEGDAGQFAQVALRTGVIVLPGTTLSVDESHSNYLRLPFLLDTEQLCEGVKRLAWAWNYYEANAKIHSASASAIFTV